MFVLTDGIPNIGEPPQKDYEKAIKLYQEQHGGGDLPGTVHTFGFGYSLDSALLYRIALTGQGMFSFIPDR